MKAFVPNLDAKLRVFGVSPSHFGPIRDLVENGTQPSEKLRLRLRRDRRYKAALNSVLAELSQPVIARHFPPVPSSLESIEI